MSKANAVFQAPPLEVEIALKRLGANLKTARLARNFSMDQVAEKLGIGRRSIATAEAGKPGTAVGVYFGLLWAYGLISQAAELADPTQDATVQRAIRARGHAYPTGKNALDSDF
ncbi:MAG TPA: helix-turn-helix domain-containing protein [Dehalococcoidia bacterium]|nr:helix-turn-helix domain-containing protein [Dehalococcoidia bacterium]